MKNKKVSIIAILALVFFISACNPPKEESDPLTDLVTIIGISAAARGRLNINPSSKCGTGVTCTTSQGNITSHSVNFGNFYVHASNVSSTSPIASSRTTTLVINNLGPGIVSLESATTFEEFPEFTFSPGLSSLTNRNFLANESTELNVTFTPPTTRILERRTNLRLQTINNDLFNSPVVSNPAIIVSLVARATSFAVANCPSENSAVRVNNQGTIQRTIYFFTTLALCQGNNTGTSNSNASLTFSNVAPNSITAYQCVPNGRYFYGDGTGPGGCTTSSVSYSGFDILLTYTGTAFSERRE